MYCYIADPPQTKSDQAFFQTLREQVVAEGIGGEFVFRAPGQSASDLAQSAIQHHFSTIVGVGDEDLAGEIAGTLYDQPIALGFIPTAPTSSMITLTGITNWRDGISALRRRKLSLQDVACVNGNQYFLTSIRAVSPSSQKFFIHTDRYVAEMKTDQLFISLHQPGSLFDVPGVIHFASFHSNHSFFARFRSHQSASLETLLRAESAAVQSEKPVTLFMGKKNVGTTPISLTVIPQSIRLITARNLVSI